MELPPFSLMEVGVRASVTVGAAPTTTVIQSGSEAVCPEDADGSPAPPGVATTLKCKDPPDMGAVKLGVPVPAPVKDSASEAGVFESGPLT